MQIACPHCSTNLDVSEEYFGHNVQCPNCQGRFQVSRDEVKSSSRGLERPERQGWEEKDHANAPFLQGFLYALGVTVIFFLLMLPFKDTRVGGLFLERGWVNYAETFLFFWGISILLLKLRKIRHQAQAALLNLFPDHLGREIHEGNVGEFIENIYNTPASLRDSLIVNRVRKGLELFEARVDNGEVAAFLETQSELDANRSSGSYVLTKTFLWAIPILGFIGTVMGLSAAVGSLSMGDSADPEALKSSINSLTGGLGIAFDTTLLGLILSILLSFPLAAVQRKEDETLTIIDTVVTEKLLPKLNDSKRATTDELIEQAESIPQLVSSLARAHETFLGNLNDSTRMLAEAGDTLENRLKAHQQKVESEFSRAISGLEKSSTDIFLKAHQNLERSFENMANGIDQINRALRDLGENQIPNEAKKKRKGFFGR